MSCSRSAVSSFSSRFFAGAQNDNVMMLGMTTRVAQNDNRRAFRKTFLVTIDAALSS
ncbi:MAG: hypothetical protein IAC06_01490 [Bacteroidetes bacterium]|uniref:Uncharacterized protein n=1 Tax=Candidatus Cryptobacteroides intestinavium TaxID=2840766 RepID=A0A9D9EPA0_9BACT|nr:hypothetical protein [Candidatus Cryptobacteroides intestinavium]